MRPYTQMNSVYTDRMHSFMVLLRRYISGTCLFLMDVFSLICKSDSATLFGKKILIHTDLNYIEAPLCIVGLD